MKRIILCICSILIIQEAKAQFSNYNLEENRTTARLSNANPYINDDYFGQHGYFVKDVEDNLIPLIYSSAFWFSGSDVNDQFKISRGLYDPTQSDFIKGPFSSNNQYNNPLYQEKYGQMIWAVSKQEVENHVLNFNQPGYQMPLSIEKWPANGDPSLGVADDLAPYIDADGDGFYNPANGDYPCIKGDRAVYIIMNDMNDNPPVITPGTPIGLEYHLMVYQFNSDNYLDSTTFLQLRSVNRHTQTLFNFKVAMFTDFDLGNSEDDFFGSSQQKNMIYVYNGTNTDSYFGVNPPAFGVVALNHEISSANYLIRANVPHSYSFINTDPTMSIEEYVNLMNGKWKNGEPFKSGGLGFELGGSSTDTVSFLYDGNPNMVGEWSELANGNTPGDRRGLMSFDHGTFSPGTNLYHNFAFILNRSGSHLQNVNGLLNYADSVQHFYNTVLQPENCLTYNLSLNAIEVSTFSIYPNPAQSFFNIKLENMSIESIKIFSTAGVLVHEQAVYNGEHLVKIDTSNLASGVYFVQVGEFVKRVVVE